MIYVSGPYTSDDIDVQVERYRAHKRYTASLIRMQLVAFSPIVHCHELAIDYELPKGYEFWRVQCLGMLAKAEMMHVMKLEGWEDSVGTQDEIDFAMSNNISLIYTNVGLIE